MPRKKVSPGEIDFNEKSESVKTLCQRLLNHWQAITYVSLNASVK